jgi:hypothetical protein
LREASLDRDKFPNLGLNPGWDLIPYLGACFLPKSTSFLKVKHVFCQKRHSFLKQKPALMGLIGIIPSMFYAPKHLNLVKMSMFCAKAPDLLKKAACFCAKGTNFR